MGIAPSVIQNAIGSVDVAENPAAVPGESEVGDVSAA
jgi:hypothetical protein